MGVSLIMFSLSRNVSLIGCDNWLYSKEIFLAGQASSSNFGKDYLYPDRYEPNKYVIYCLDNGLHLKWRMPRKEETPINQPYPSERRIPLQPIPIHARGMGHSLPVYRKRLGANHLFGITQPRFQRAFN